MANLRIVSNNVANAAAITAPTGLGLPAANMLTDIKTEYWRSTDAASAIPITLTWASSVSVSMVALAFTNLSPTATISVSGYTNSGDASPAFTTAPTLCCAGSQDQTAPIGFGGGVNAEVWFAQASVQKLIVTVSDTSNPSGYIRIGRLVTGAYWTPDRNIESDSLRLTFQEDTKTSRAESGTLWTDRGPVYKKLQFDLSYLTPADRTAIWKIVTSNGMSSSMYISAIPESVDATETQMYSLYGRLSASTAFSYKYVHLQSTQMQIEEV